MVGMEYTNRFGTRKDRRPGVSGVGTERSFSGTGGRESGCGYSLLQNANQKFSWFWSLPR